MFVFWYSLLFVCELCFLVAAVEPVRDLCPWTLQALFFLWWTRWLLAVQVFNPDFYWSGWRGVLFWGLQCLGSLVYAEGKPGCFRILYLCGMVFSAFCAYLYDLAAPAGAQRDALFLVSLAINLLLWVLLSALVELKHAVTARIKPGQNNFSGGIRQALGFALPILHAGSWLAWGMLLQAGKKRVAFLMYFGCTATQLGALRVQIRERRLNREVRMELVEINTYFK